MGGRASHKLCQHRGRAHSNWVSNVSMGAGHTQTVSAWGPGTLKLCQHNYTCNCVAHSHQNLSAYSEYSGGWSRGFFKVLSSKDMLKWPLPESMDVKLRNSTTHHAALLTLPSTAWPALHSRLWTSQGTGRINSTLQLSVLRQSGCFY